MMNEELLELIKNDDWEYVSNRYLKNKNYISVTKMDLNNEVMYGEIYNKNLNDVNMILYKAPLKIKKNSKGKILKLSVVSEEREWVLKKKGDVQDVGTI